MAFLPINLKEAKELGFDTLDFVIITGDAYVDHPSFGTALIGRVLEAAGFTDIGRDLYALTEDGIYLIDSEKQIGDAEADFESFAEFAPIYDGHLTKKGLSRLHISLEASEGAKVSVYISYDGGEWIKAKEISSSKRQNYNIPLTIRRCGYYRIRIEGKGNYIIYAIGKVRYFGSDM